VPGSRSIKGACQTLEKQGADKQKRLHPHWVVTLQKNYILFAMDKCFLLTGAFLLGANSTTFAHLQISCAYHTIFRGVNTLDK